MIMAPIDYNDPNDPWRTPGYDPYKGMSDKQKFLASLGQVIGIVLGTVVAMILCALFFSSCTTTQYVPVIEHKTDTVYQNKVKHDSIWQHDSVQIMIKGDSVTIDRWHTKYVSKEVHDTTYISKTDSVPVPYPVEKLVPAELTTWQKLRMNIGTFMIFATLLFAVGWLLKRKFLP
jgi:hypothetical protein